MNNFYPSERESDHTTGPAPKGRLTDHLSFADTSAGRAAAHFLRRYESKANAAGIQLEMHTDFEEFEKVARTLEGKGAVSPPFLPRFSDIGPVNGFWLKGLDPRGDVVQIQAVRVDDLTGNSLANHMRTLNFFYSDPAKSAHPQETCRVDAPASSGISGRVCYQGEFWIKGGKNGYRGHAFATIFLRIGMAVALARWDPDFIYATVASVLVEKGVVARYGYHNLQPHGIVWSTPQNEDVMDEWIMWLSWRELVDLIERSN